MIFREVPKDGIPVTQARDYVEKNRRIRADVVVVGAGCGGSIMAFELANAGFKVVVLESGPYIPSSDMHEDMAETLQRNYVDGGLQVNSTFDVPIFEGRGMGGSTVIDAAVAFRAPDYILQRWAKDLKLPAMAPDRLEPFYRKVEQRWSVHINEPHEINENANKVIQGCDDMGWSWKPLARTVKECALTGHCLAGCVSDRKQSSLVTYLPWAVALGAELYSDCHVWKILIENGRAAGVMANIVDPESGEMVAEVRVDAQLVVVAAGAIQSPMLLQKSGLGVQSGMVGHNLYLNPFVSVIGRFPQAVYGWRGALSGVCVDQFLAPHDGKTFMISGLPEPVQLLSTGGLGVQKSHLRFMGEYRYYAMLQTFVQDEGQGYVHWEGHPVLGSKHIDWNLSENNFRDLKTAITNAARIFFAAGAEAVLLPTFDRQEVDSVFNLDKAMATITMPPKGMYALRVASLSPQGTCRMGADPFSAVVNEVCESYEVHGLFVTDASVLPESVTVAPKMTVAAIASYVADYIVKNHKSYIWT